MIPHLVILAPGLLGGSVAQAARHFGAARRITIWSRRAETRLALQNQPWCDAVADTPEAAVAEATLVVLAAPVERIVELAGLIAPALPPGAIVTDVGSTKGSLTRACQAVTPKHAHFVGSHPMAGSEKTGWENGSATLFTGRSCFVTPLDGITDPSAAEMVARFWHDVGAKVTTVNPDLHDEIVAHISHLPQVVATALSGFLAQRPHNWRSLAGNGLRDTTRIAGGDSTMWLEIFQQNRDEVLRALSKLQDELQGFHAALANRDWMEVRARLERGRDYRNGFPT